MDMQKLICTLCVLVLLLPVSCMLMVPDNGLPGGNIPNGPVVPVDTHTTVKNVSFKTRALFPFEDNSNWWRYSEVQGNQLSIMVTDTISDDGVTYYRVLFQEHWVDTTDDWFKCSSGGIMFGAALSGVYSTFLPAVFNSVSGSFVSGGSTVDYEFHDSTLIGGVMYHNVFVCDYTMPVLHSFDQIIFADSIGIVELKDLGGRWPIEYFLDSCSINGVKRAL
jgi:hypothetical protein